MAAIAAGYTEQLTGKPRISYEEFLALPDDIHAEWVDGEVVPMPSVSLLHLQTVRFLLHLIQAFLEERPLGELLFEPFQVRVRPGRTGRAPDLMFLRNEHRDRLQRLFVEDAADLIVEVVSPAGAARDYVEKFREYEGAGIPEYWIIDPENHEASFFVLREGRYEQVRPSTDGVYRSTVLEGFWIRAEWLWERPRVRELIDEILRTSLPES